MRERESHYADVAVRPPSGLPAVLREDHPDGSEPTSAAATLCHLPSEDTETAPGATARH